MERKLAKTTEGRGMEYLLSTVDIVVEEQVRGILGEEQSLAI